MISIDDYQINYEIFLAEQEFFKGIIQTGVGYFNESSDLISLNESVKDVVMKYLEKISAAIQKAWDKFKEIVNKAKDAAYIKMIKSKMENPKPAFIIENYVEYNMNLLDSIRLIPFDYEQMKESLTSKKDFLSKYYSRVYRNPEESVLDNFNNVLISSVSDKECTPELLKQMYNFITVDFPNKIANIENDLKIVNNSNKTIERLISMIAPSTVNNEMVSLFENYIIEADEKEPMKFRDTGENQGVNSNLVKEVNVYVSSSVDILTNKMKVYRNIYAQYMKTIKHYIKPEKEPEKKPEEEVQTTTSKVEIKI